MQLIKRANQYFKEQSLRGDVNKDIRSMANVVAKSAPNPDPDKIVISFNASTRISGLSLNAAFAMLTGWSLRLQGVRLVKFVCHWGMTRCVLGTDRTDVRKVPPCQKCINQSRTINYKQYLRKMEFFPSSDLAKSLQNLDVSRLRHFRYDGIPLGYLCLPSMRWVLRRHHLHDDLDTQILYRHYILSAYKIAVQFEKLLYELNPSSVFIFNGMQFPEATARWMARKFGAPAYSHEVGLLPYSCFITEGDATAYPVDISDDFQLSDEQNQQLDEYLSQRFKGDFSMAGVQFWPEMTGLDGEFVQKIESFKQVVPIFTNVIFDTSQPHANTNFPHMFAWLERVLRVIESHPESLFVIRAHPDESRPGKASQESVSDWVQDRGVEALSNVIFVGPEDYFSSYEMIQRAKFVMIYNSTIGMEASIMGAPVLCAGQARFTQLDTVYFPDSKQVYMAKLEEFLNAETVPVLEAHQINARRFLYYQLYRTSLPFDRYIEPDNVWPGFVRLKSFSWQDLLPENSPVMQVISNGLLNGKGFILPQG